MMDEKLFRQIDTISKLTSTGRISRRLRGLLIDMLLADKYLESKNGNTGNRYEESKRMFRNPNDIAEVYGGLPEHYRPLLNYWGEQLLRKRDRILQRREWKHSTV